MVGIYSVLAALDATSIVTLFIDILTAVMTGVPAALVIGFDAAVSDSAGTGFSLLAIWAVVLMMFFFSTRLVYSLLNKIKG